MRLVNHAACLRSREEIKVRVVNQGQPNNSLDASGNSEPLMLDLLLIAVRAAASIRALGVSQFVMLKKG
jgi:hypothetical protein